MLTLYDKLKMVEKRIKDKSKERENLWTKINSEGISIEINPDHEYFAKIEEYRVIINAFMTERNTLMDTINSDIIGKEA
jgi:hypothetical protein